MNAQTDSTSLAVRLPYSADIQDTFAVDVNTWKVLVEAVWPEAQSVESVKMALSYCRARHLDPLKRVVHIVPIWNKAKGKLVDTVWPAIAEARITAARTKSYAGRDPTVFGPDMTMKWGEIEVTFPEWAQITVYRFVEGQRVAFAGPQVFWRETFATTKNGAPNSMWQKRPRGQLDKCAERAALATGFPEEVGDEFSEADGPGIYQHMEANAREQIQMPQRKSVTSTQPQEPPPVQQPKRQSAPTNGGAPGSVTELQHICQALADAGVTVTTTDYAKFELAPAVEEETADTICEKLSSFIGRDKTPVLGRTAANLSERALAITLRKARGLMDNLQQLRNDTDDEILDAALAEDS